MISDTTIELWAAVKSNSVTKYKQKPVKYIEVKAFLYVVKQYWLNDQLK